MAISRSEVEKMGKIRLLSLLNLIEVFFSKCALILSIFSSLILEMAVKATKLAFMEVRLKVCEIVEHRFHVHHIPVIIFLLIFLSVQVCHHAKKFIGYLTTQLLIQSGCLASF